MDMDKVEAKRVLNKELSDFPARPYSELVELIDKPDVVEVLGAARLTSLNSGCFSIRNGAEICVSLARSMMEAGELGCLSPKR